MSIISQCLSFGAHPANRYSPVHLWMTVTWMVVCLFSTFHIIQILGYHSRNPYPQHYFYHPTHDDDDSLLSLPLSFSSSSPPLSPLATLPPHLDFGPHEQQQAPESTATIDGSPWLPWATDNQCHVGIQAASLSLLPLLLFNPCQSFPYDEMSAIPGSPSHRQSRIFQHPKPSLPHHLDLDLPLSFPAL